MYVPYIIKTRQSNEDTPIHTLTQTVGLLWFLKANRKRHEGMGKQ